VVVEHGEQRRRPTKEVHHAEHAEQRTRDVVAAGEEKAFAGLLLWFTLERTHV